MFRILFCMCWQTEKKICLVYVLDITQRCMFQALSLSSMNRKLDSTDQKSQKLDSAEFLNKAQAR